jgi:hypothetical protein
MQALSAADAVAPAIHRTKNFLFRPFEFWTYLKLCLVAVITEGFGGNFNSSFPGGGRGHGHTSPGPTHVALSPGWIAFIVLAVLVAIVVSFLLYYLITRLRFAFFHCLVRQSREISPGWHLYRNQANRFFGLSLAVGIIFLVMMGLIVLPFALGLFRVFRASRGHPDLASILSYALPLIPIVLLFILIGMAVHLVLTDFVMPHMALENASAGDAWAAVRARIVAEKASFFVYALLRIVLPIVGSIAVVLILLIPGLILLGGSALVIFGLHAAFAHATGADAALGISLQVIVGIAAFCLIAVIGLFFGGPLSVWVRTYALMFYGGRYQALGDFMAPSPQMPPIGFGA